MDRRLVSPALLLTMIALSACAGGEKPDKGPGWRGGPTRGDRLAPVHLFISPSGEPFRGEDGLSRWIAQVDTDHDGAISLAEFRADAQHSFKVIDTNGDGVIDGIELQHYEHDIVPEVGVETFDAGPSGARPAGGGRRGGGHGGRGARADSGLGPDLSAQAGGGSVAGAGRMGAARYSLLNEPQPIAAADTDLDGKVTMAEWMAITDRRFTKLDRYKTGKLTMDSLLHPPKAKDAPPKAP